MRNSRFISPTRETQLKSALAQRLVVEYPELDAPLVYQAIDEAGTLASSTSVPLLVLPALAEEKVRKIAVCFAGHASPARTEPVAFAA